MHTYVLGCHDFRMLVNDGAQEAVVWNHAHADTFFNEPTMSPEGPLPTSQSGGAAPVLSRNLHLGE